MCSHFDFSGDITAFPPQILANEREYRIEYILHFNTCCTHKKCGVSGGAKNDELNRHFFINCMAITIIRAQLLKAESISLGTAC